MHAAAEKTSKPTQVARKEATEGSFFRKASDASFFSNAESKSFFSPPVQAKLSISKPDDPYEREADHVADQVMSAPAPHASEPAAKKEDELQRKEEEKQEEIQPKFESPHITALQRKPSLEEDKVQPKLFSSLQRQPHSSEASHEVGSADESQTTIFPKLFPLARSPDIQRSGRDPPGSLGNFEPTLNSSKGGGSALPDNTKQHMESRFGADFSGVRIHTGSTAESLSSNIHAQAFTHGNDIYFNSGKYSPNTSDGGRLLAHELTHTIQQGASTKQSAPAQTVSRKPIIQRAAHDRPVPSQLNNAVAKAKSLQGQINADKEGADGFREGWQHLVEIFKTTFGAEKIISGGGGTTVTGAVSEQDIKKKRKVNGLPPADPKLDHNGPFERDAMPSWCGIFAFFALHKGGVPMRPWELGGRMISPDAAYPKGYIPKTGDIAYRNAYSHYALVEKSDGATVTTINGNTAGEDNLGGQVQSHDHPMENWTAFFDPLMLKDGELTNGETTAVVSKPKTLRELRKELFHVDRKEEPGEKEEERPQSDVQAKSDLSDTYVDASGSLTHAAIQPKTAEEEKLQKKEEHKDEEEITESSKTHALQRMETDQGDASVEDDRGPPVQMKSADTCIQCGWFDDAISFVDSAIDYAEKGLAKGKELILGEARDFAMAIPGYKALRVVLGEDPITGENVERNGHNFIEAAFDIIPFGTQLHRKLTSLGALSTAEQWIDTQIARVNNIVHNVIASVEQFIESITLSDLGNPRALFERAGNIIHNAIQSVIDFAITAGKELLEIIKRFLLTQLAEFVKKHTSAYPLLCVILGEDPITHAKVAPTGANILNAMLLLGGEEGAEQKRQMMETGSFAKVAAWIDKGIVIFSGAYQQIVAGIAAIWDYVTIDSLVDPIGTFTKIYDTFAKPVGDVLKYVKETIIMILKFVKEVLMKRLAEWAKGVKGYKLVCVIIGKDPFTGEKIPFTTENVIHGFMNLMDGGEEQFQQLKESGAIDKAAQKIAAAVAKLNMTPEMVIHLFKDIWESFSFKDLANPIAAFKRIMAKFGEPIMRLVEFVIEIIKIVVYVILQVMQFPFDLINNIIAKAMQAFELIKLDPVGFLKNLLRSIKQGFVQFFANMLTHLWNGLKAWLKSELEKAGMPLPEDYTAGGIIKWLLAVLDITMEKIWFKLEARVGKEKVDKIRKLIERAESAINTAKEVYDFIQDVRKRGMEAIVDRVKEKLTNMWDMVLDTVKSFIMEQVVDKVTQKLLSMLDPTSIMAIVNSAIALYKAIQSFIAYIRQMLEIVNSFVEGTLEIAQGSIKKGADFLEGSLARGIPIVIGFLANQIGLNLADKIKFVLEKLREKVDKGLDWIIDKLVGFVEKLVSMGKKAVAKIVGWWKAKKTFKTKAGEEHKLYFEGEGKSAKLTLRSEPQTFEHFISEAAKNIDPKAKDIVSTLVATAKTKAKEVDAEKAREIKADKDPEKATEEKKQADKIEVLLSELAPMIKEIFDVSPAGDEKAPTPATQKVVDYLKDSSNRAAVLTGDRAKTFAMLKLHGVWRDLVADLQKMKDPIYAAVINGMKQYRDFIVADLRVDPFKFTISGKSPSVEAASDVDMATEGPDAGKRMIEGEAHMKKMDPNWTKLLRMNFYTTKDRITMYRTVLDIMGDALFHEFEKIATYNSEILNFAKMLQHAKGNAESTERVTAMMDHLSANQKKLVYLFSEEPKATAEKRVKELHEQIDKQHAVLEGLDKKDEQRIDVAKNITLLQMEANFRTQEAYIGPGGSRQAVEGASVKGQQAYQALLGNLEMMEHTISSAKHDIGKAVKEYELYKYIARFIDAMKTGGLPVNAFMVSYYDTAFDVYKGKDAKGNNKRDQLEGVGKSDLSYLVAMHTQFANEAHEALKDLKKKAFEKNANATPDKKILQSVHYTPDGDERDPSGPDKRTLEEKTKDLQSAIDRANGLLFDRILDKTERDKRLEAIRKQYRLKELKYVVDKDLDDGGSVVHAVGEVNPIINGRPININYALAEKEVYWPPMSLQWHKAKGGHTIERHTDPEVKGLDESTHTRDQINEIYLKSRIWETNTEDPRSLWNSQATAESIASSLLPKNQASVLKWLLYNDPPGDIGPRIYKGSQSNVLGYGLINVDGQIYREPMWHAKLVLRRTTEQGKNTFYILTTYPE